MPQSEKDRYEMLLRRVKSRREHERRRQIAVEQAGREAEEEEQKGNG